MRRIEQLSALAQTICGLSDWPSNITQLSYMINYKHCKVVVMLWLLLVVEKNGFKDDRFASGFVSQKQQWQNRQILGKAQISTNTRIQ